MYSFTGHAAKYATKFINSTNCHVFLTGKAGTGKTTFLKYITEHSHKKTIVAAPTGIAAINAGGVTLHSLFQLPFGAFLPSNNVRFGNEISVQLSTPNTVLGNRQMNKTKIAMIREMELLIIDEVSMLRADLLDAINIILQSIRRNRQSFGGVQILFIGDLWQLPPVVKEEEWQYLKQFYSGIFFFEAQALKENKPLLIELDKIYRQDDIQFIELLNNLRENRITTRDIETLNSHYKPDFIPGKKDGFIKLVTHNYQADVLNHESLKSLPGKSYFYSAEIEGDFNEYQFPIEFSLEFKKDAQVMFIKNDYSGEGKYFNGKLGIIKDLSSDFIEVEFKDGTTALVDFYTWQNKRFTLNKETNQIEEEILGTFRHYPIKLAWAITVHKSQGLTFERAIIDVSKAFAAGQVYVALSRLTSLDGLILTSRLNEKGLEPERSLKDFAAAKPEITDLDIVFERESQKYIGDFILRTFEFSSVLYQLKTFKESYDKDEKRSVKQQHYSWVIDLYTRFDELKPISDKLLIQLKRIIETNPCDLNYLLERLSKAKEYFEKQLKELSESVIIHIKQVESEKGVKKYITELRDIELLFFGKVQQIYKAEALLKASIEKKEISKDELIQSSINTNRSQIVKELNTKSSRTRKDKIKKEKVPKISTNEISYNLYKSGMSIIEIAKDRGMVESTIERHLATYVASGILDVTKFLKEDKLNKILEIILNSDSLMLGELMSNSKGEFTYVELQMAVAHYKSRNLGDDKIDSITT